MLICNHKGFLCSTEAHAGFSNKDSVKKEVKASLTQKATLSCEVSDSKTEVKWYKDGKLLSSTKAVHVESKDKIRELVIEKMDKKDAGEYTCEAGTEKLVFRLQVAGEYILILIHSVINQNYCCKALKNIHPCRCRSEVPKEGRQ